MEAISAGEVADQLGKMRDTILRTKFTELQRNEERKKTQRSDISVDTVAGLMPWREVVEPHQDVATGEFQQAVVARPDQDAVKLEPRRVAECFELGRCFFEFHGNRDRPRPEARQANFERSRNIGSANPLLPRTPHLPESTRPKTDSHIHGCHRLPPALSHF